MFQIETHHFKKACCKNCFKLLCSVISLKQNIASNLFTITHYAYLGHGVTLEIKSSTPNDSPRINNVDPRPFHKVVIP